MKLSKQPQNLSFFSMAQKKTFLSDEKMYLKNVKQYQKHNQYYNVIMKKLTIFISYGNTITITNLFLHRLNIRPRRCRQISATTKTKDLVYQPHEY